MAMEFDSTRLTGFAKPNARGNLHGSGTRNDAETGRMGSEEISRDGE